MGTENSVSEFLVTTPHECDTFRLEPTFSIKLKKTGKELNNLVFSESRLLKAIYTNSTVYKRLGKSACSVIDVSMAMGGSEAIAESYYSVMASQKKDGGQSNETLEKQTFIDWSLPNILTCKNTIEEISKFHLKNHKIPIFVDERNRTRDKYYQSKVLTKLANAEKLFKIFD